MASARSAACDETVVGETVGPEEAAGPTGVRAMFADIGVVELPTPYRGCWRFAVRDRFVLLILGPLEVLLRSIRDPAGGGATEYGLVLASFGIVEPSAPLLISSRVAAARYLKPS